MSSRGAGVMLGEQDQQNGLVPKLRFPEFRDDPAWELWPLKKLAKRRTRKNVGAKVDRVLTNSAEHGVVDQRDYFEKDIANPGNLEGYFIIEKGDYVYNPRISNLAPVGPIHRNDVGLGVMSPLYTVFFFDCVKNDFYSHYFKTPHWHQYLRHVSNSGARHDRMAISADDFINMPVPVSNPLEQQKIADCLSSIDAVIAAEAEKLEALKDHKKGLMQQLFPAPGETSPSRRFPEFQSAGEWKERLLGEVCDVAQGYGFPQALQGKPSGEFPFCKVSDISRAVSDKGGVLDSAVNYVDLSDLKILKAKLIPAGATVFAKIGEALRLNRRAISGVECLIDNNAVALKAKSGVASDYFVFLLSQMIDMNEHCGGAVPSVNKSTLERISVIIPQPKEQQKIAEHFSSCNAIIALQAEKIDALRA